MALSRAKAIRAKCLDCCCGNAAEVRRCSIESCPLFPFKSGHLSKKDAKGGNNTDDGIEDEEIGDFSDDLDAIVENMEDAE